MMHKLMYVFLICVQWVHTKAKILNEVEAEDSLSFSLSVQLQYAIHMRAVHLKTRPAQVLNFSK